MNERKFDNIISCIEYLDSAVLPSIRSLDCGETIALTICCGEDELYIHIFNYNKELDEISFNSKMINLTEDTRIGDAFNCEPMKLFISIVGAFIQGYCLENLYEGHCIRVNFVVMEANLCADVNEEYEDCEYYEDESEIDAYLSDMSDVHEDVDNDGLPF